MRFFEIIGGLRVPVSAEEQAILDRAAQDAKVARSDLNPREQEVARHMTSRGLLRRFREDEKTHFAPNTDPTIRRN